MKTLSGKNSNFKLQNGGFFSEKCSANCSTDYQDYLIFNGRSQYSRVARSIEFSHSAVGRSKDAKRTKVNLLNIKKLEKLKSRQIYNMWVLF